MATFTENLKLRSKLYFYAAQVTDVYDGDTITVDIDLGLGLWRHDQRVRLWKINTPEVRGPEREQGLRVRDIVREMVLGKEILLRTILDRHGVDSTEKFGRLLGEVLITGPNDESLNLNEYLLAEGLALPMGEDGSMQPRGVDPALPTTVVCRYCGETRLVDPATGVILICPNCLDPAY
jgi:micrococcal nuclease